MANAVSHKSDSLPLAIEAHRPAIAIDEAFYFNDGQPKSALLADETGKAEVAAYLAMVSAPCATDEEVQVKVSYILDGSIGERATLVECLEAEEYGGSATLQDFLRSLALQGAKLAVQTP